MRVCRDFPRFPSLPHSTLRSTRGSGLEQRISNEGAVRVRSAKGWVSATNLNGTPLLRPAREGEGTPGSPQTSAELGGAASYGPGPSPLRLPSKADLVELSGLLRPPSAVAAVLRCVLPKLR